VIEFLQKPWLGSGNVKPGLEAFFADFGLHGGNQTRFFTRFAKNMPKESGGGGFPVGTGNADDGHFFGGKTVKRGPKNRLGKMEEKVNQPLGKKFF